VPVGLFIQSQQSRPPGTNPNMATPYPIRPIAQHEFPAFNEVLEQAFNSGSRTEPELEHDLVVFEFDRTLAAFDGPQMVGTAAAFTLQLSVPGGVTPVAGVAAVSVLPTHRRRGILTSLMRRQLSDIRDRGEPVAALWASESGIYGRYGYAPATTETEFTIRRGEGAFPAPGPGPWPACSGEPPRLRIADPSGATSEMAQVYRSVLRQRPGLTARDDRWWDYLVWDPPHRGDEHSPVRCLVAEDEVGPRGYALYAAGHDRGDYWTPGDALHVRELMAADPPAYAALWRDLLTRDLVSKVTAPARPPDDPLPHLLADGRRARPKVTDGLWVRLVSLPQALVQRRYACPVDVVIDVTDDLFQGNAGRWRLRAEAPADPADQQRATCERTTAPPDVALPVTVLGAAYLGGTRLSGFAGAGLVSELRPGRLAALSAALSWDPAPWSPTHF
jgi:predicted acetyltransferase